MTEATELQPENDFVADPALPAIAALLAMREITRIVVVDDDFPAAGDFEIGVVLAALGNPKLQLLPFAQKYQADIDLLNGDVLASDDFIADELRAKWDQLDAGLKTELEALVSVLQPVTPAAKSASPGYIADDSGAILGLSDFLPDGFDLQQMNLAQWESVRDDLFKGEYPPTIVFFDRDFSKEGRGKEEGDKLVEHLWRRHLPRVYLGLLTHDPATEASIIAELGAKLGEEGQVSVIAKKRLQEATLFAEGLRVYLAIGELHVMRAHVLESIRLSAESAQETVASADYYTLMAAFEGARREGVFEAEGIVRLAQNTLRESLAMNIRATGTPEWPMSSLLTLREIAKIELYPFGLEHPADLETVKWKDKFESGEHLAKLHAPLEVGDIFALRKRPHLPAGTNNSEKHFILLVQPCDLSLRVDGKRANQLDFAVLAEIRARSVGRDGKLKALRPNEFELGVYNPELGRPWVVDVTQVVHVTTRALDACVLRADGEGTLTTNMMPAGRVAEGWEIRAKELGEWADKITGQMATFSAPLEDVKPKADKERMIGFMAAGLSEAGSGSNAINVYIDPTKKVVRYGIRRVGRLVGSMARALLVVASQHQSRPDVENDLLADIDLPPTSS